MSRWRALLPRTWREALVPQWGDQPADSPATLPPWQSAGGGVPRLESHRFEHEGAHHRLHLRESADGSGLVVVDASRLARVNAGQLGMLRAALRSGMQGAAALEQSIWGEAVLTGTGNLRACNAWESGAAGADPVPDVPIVATLEVAAESDEITAARVLRLRDLAVPHVVLRPLGEGAASAVVAAVRTAEDAGLIAGVAAPADFVDDGRVLDDLAALGLDHLALTLAGPDAATHDAVLGAGEHAKLVRLAARAARLEVPLTAEVPLVASNWQRVGEILAVAPQLGVRGITAWALVEGAAATGALAPPALRQVAATLEQAADRADLPVTWAAPARVRSVGEGVMSGPRSEGDFGMRVTAGGDVLPPRASAAPAGRLDDDWRTIRDSASWRAFLQRARGSGRCDACPGLALCAVDCPAAEEGWA